jgi:catechol 2,3-dioxygenase-like lactoylglutathione lyase family enzyme
MPFSPGPSIITLGAHDLDGLRAFYARLGWEEAPVGASGWASFEIGGALLTLFPLGDHADDCSRTTPVTAAAGSADGAFRGLTIALSVEYDEDVDMSLELARAAGATVLKEPDVAPWGARSAYFADPEGNVWEIACMAGASFGDGGALPAPEA